MHRIYKSDYFGFFPEVKQKTKSFLIIGQYSFMNKKVVSNIYKYYTN